MSRVNPRLAKRHWSYTTRELADLLSAHKNSVRQWIREGLPVVDGARPILILGGEFQAWWGKRTKARKRPCQPGQLYCFKCRAPKAPALGMIEYAATKRIRLDRISARMPGMDVRRTLAPSSIAALSHSSPNCDNPKGA